MSEGKGPYPLEVVYQPIGGINSYDSATSLEMEVVDSQNFFFDRKAAYTRGGHINSSITGMGGNTPTNGADLELNGLPYSVLMDATGNLWTLSVNAATAVTMTTGSVTGAPFSFVSVNGVLMISGLTSGPLRWVPGAAACANVTSGGVQPKYMVQHLSRAIGANDLAATNGYCTVKGSVPGDETDWTSVLLGAFSSTLASIPDDITGLAVLHDVLLIVRRFGIHVGYVTTQLNPAYNFAAFDNRGIGCFVDLSLAQDKNSLFFIGEDDIYKFDLSNGAQAIGKGVKNVILSSVHNGSTLYKGVVFKVPVNATLTKTRYALFPLSGNVVYIFDDASGMWSKHTTGGTDIFSAWGAFPAGSQGTPPAKGTGMAWLPASSPRLLSRWNDSATPQDAASTLTCKVINPQSPSKDYMLRRILMRNKDNAVTNNVTLTTTSRQGKTAQTDGGVTVNVGANADNYWVHNWFDTQLSGNNFQTTLSVPSGHGLELDLLLYEFSESGAFRG